MAKAEQNKMVSEVEVQEYQLLYPLLMALQTEMKEFSKKKQDGVLNKLKVTMVNNILKRIRSLLKKEPTSQFITLLDDETLPTNSDVVLILAQCASVMQQFQIRYYRKDTCDIFSRWHTKENP